MKFDINKVISEMITAVKDTVGDNLDEVVAVTSQFFNSRKERLELLADLRITGDISQKRFESRLNDEKLIVEAEFQAITVISKAIAQKAANAAIEVLENAVKTAINLAK